ncbi:MAG: EamA family transporter [Bacillota bacterium]
MKKSGTIFGYSAWGISNLFVIYIVWSSTYLAMAYMVAPVGGFPPFWSGATRLLGGGIILLAISVARRQPLFPGWKILKSIGLSALLLWVLGNGLVLFALNRGLGSGVTAVIIGTTPIWSIIIDAVASGKRLSKRLIIAMCAGTSGMIVLNVPNFNGAIDVVALIAVIVSAMAWGAGTVFQSRRLSSVNVATLAGWQQIIAALGFYTLSLLFSEQLHAVSSTAVYALVYLTIAAQVISMLAFTIAVSKLPVAVVMSYAYVNPVLALALGCFLNGEKVTVFTILGALIITLGVVVIFWKKRM